MDYISLIPIGIAVASVLGIFAAGFYSVNLKTVNATLKESNDAYKERNIQLESQLSDLTKEYSAKLAELEGRIKTLEKIKTPPFEPLIKLITSNHTETMTAIEGKKQ